MEKWEYMANTVYADTESAGVKEALKARWPHFEPLRYSPVALVPLMDRWGEEGWELVHMEPVADLGRTGNVGFPMGGMGGMRWSNYYFCVLKRREV